MGGMKADGVLYLAAEFLDTFNEIEKQVKKGAAKISEDTKINLSIDAQNVLKDIDKQLKGTKFKGLDLSSVIIPRLEEATSYFLKGDSFNANIGKTILDNLYGDLKLINAIPTPFVKYFKNMKPDDMAGAVKEVRHKISEHDLEHDPNAIRDIFFKYLQNSETGAWTQFIKEFENIAKYGVGEKEAEKRLREIESSLEKKVIKEQERYKGSAQEGTKVGLEDVASEQQLKDIQGYYTRIESLGGTPSNTAKRLNELLTRMFNAQLIDEELDDFLYQMSEDVHAFTEQEKTLIQEAKQKQQDMLEKAKAEVKENKSSARNIVKPSFEEKSEISKSSKISASSKSIKEEKKTQENIEQEKESQKKKEQAKQVIQEITSENQSATKSNKQLTGSIKEVTQAAQQEKQAFDNLSQENVSQNKKSTISNSQKEVEIKKEVAQINKENVKLEQQITTEVEKQTKQEQQKAKAGIIRKTRKLPDVKKIGKSQTEIKEQIKQEEEDKINKKKKETDEFKKNLKESEKNIKLQKNNKREEVDISTINIGDSSELFKEFISAGEAEENINHQAQEASKSVEILKDNLKETVQTQKQLNEEVLKGKEDKNQSEELANIDKKLNDVKTNISLSKSTEEDKTKEKEIEQAKEEIVQTSKEELKTEQQITNELKQQKEVKQSINVNQQVNKTEPELQNTKKIKEETQQIIEQQKKVTEAKQETLQTAREELKTEQQLYTETQKQESAEEQKAKIFIVNKGKKLANVQRHGKTQAEIDAQFKAEKEKKKKKSSTLKSDLDEKKRAEAAAAADAEEDKEKQRQQEIEDQNFLAALRAKYAEAEAEQAKKEAQKIQVSSDKMQRLKQEIQEATESLKNYKEIDEQIVKLQSKKDAYVISPSTQDEMMQAGVLSSSIDMAEYIRSAYRTYKKTSNEADETILKEALRQYMLPIGKKKFIDVLKDEKGDYIKDENGKYKTITRIGDAYRDTSYLYSKNGKELKKYTKDKDFNAYIKQAQDEEAAYEKAQRKLPILLDQKKSGQQFFVETSAKIQQLLQEVGLDADKVNEILAAINGNLTNEEAIWKVINSYIKETTKELEKQETVTDINKPEIEIPDSKKEPNTELNLPVPKKEPVLNEVIQSEKNSLKEQNNEANGFNLIAGSAEEAAEAKRKFVEANKDVLQSIVASMPKIEQEAKALEKVEEVSNKTKVAKETKTKEDNSKTKDRKGYFDFEMMPNDLIEQRYSEISPLPILAKGVSLASNKLDDEVQSSVELLEELHTAWDRGQQEIKDIIYDSTIENMQQEYAESQRPQYDFEPDYENIARQAREARQYYEDQISDDFEVKVETKLNLIEDETGQLSLFDDILPEQNWGQEIQQNIKETSQTAIEGQISFQQLEEAISDSEKAFAKLYSSKTTAGKSFIQNKDLPNDVLQKYENISTENDKGYKATSNLRELKNLGDELANVKTKLKVSFDEAGNLKSTADPLQVQELLRRYNELVEKIQKIKLLIESPNSKEFKLLKDIKETEAEAEKLASVLEKTYAKLSNPEKILTDTEKFLNPFAEANIPMTDSIEQLVDSVGRMQDISSELTSSFDSEGKLIRDPQKVQDLITEYNNLSRTVDELKVKISSPTSKENIALNLAKDAEKAKKELDSLKAKVDKNLNKSDLFEAQTQKTIDIYGAFEGNGEGKRGTLIDSDVLKDERFAKQQEQVQKLVDKLREYKTAVQELQTLKTSDNTTTEQLTEANNKVKELKDNIITLSQTIKTSGIANVSDDQIKTLKNRLESFLENSPNLTKEARSQIEKYIEVLSSGASVSKTSFTSMTLDSKKFIDAQSKASTIWQQMVGKMREGIAFLATKFSLYQVFNQFRQGFEVIHQFDDALTEMMKVSDETRTSLERYQKTTFDTADAIGTSALQIQNSTADFMRLGETLDQAAESAKSANVLMNVSEFQSIDEATKSLIAMGAAYDDLSKMNIIDKLNEVGNNYAISTSEAATALQSSASALKTAGNNMDEALALVTAGNAVVQDATKVGTGMRTIALRLTGTKTAKEELEEMGEETENVITTQSKLRDTIKEATAVASNEFKGFDILDENGNYKSTYEIMLGIADVYNEILETDKQFGRNNANLLLESVAGKNRANIAASIFQNPQLLRDAYQSSQEANGSAMRENDKYVQSISGHIAQLTNAWQEMWANAANRDVINFFIDAAKAAVNFANAIGVIPSTLLLLTPYLEIISKARSKDGKGLISQFLDWANGLNEAKKAAEGMTEIQKGLNEATEAGTAINATATISTEAKTAADIEGTVASVDKTIADEAQATSTLEVAGAEVIETKAQEASTKADIEGAAASAAKTAANAAEAGSSAATGATGIARLTGAFSGLVSVIGVAPIAIGAAVLALMGLHKAYKDYEESLFTGAKELTNSLQSQQDTMTQQIESYTNLKNQLDSGNLSEQETINVKQQILDIQKSITDQYGSAAQGVNLINGELKEQIDLLNTITQKEAANQYWTEYKGFQVAEKEYNKNDRRYSFNILKSNNVDLNKAIENELTKAGLNGEGFGAGTLNAVFKGTASESVKELEKVKESLNDLKKEYRDPDAIKIIDKQIAEVEEQISKGYETIEKYEATALKGWELDLAANNTAGYDIYKNYQSSVSNLEDAYVGGDTQKINEARKAFIEATKAKNDFLRIGDNGQFSTLFNSIDTSLIDVKNKFRDAVELFKDIPNSDEQVGLFEEDNEKIYKKNSKALSKLTKNEQKAYKAAKVLYNLNPDKVDIEATLNDNSYASRKYADALNNLMSALGWTTKDASTLIDALVTAGIVQGNAADIGNIASDSYNNFSSSVETAITALNTLNTVLTESASGKGISNQTLEEFRKAFGEEAYQNLEKTANGYHLNVEQAYLLRQQQEALVKNDYSSALNEQYTALDRLREGYEKAILTGEDTRGFVEQEKAIRSNIQALQDEMMSFNNANSAYQTWLAKQNSEGEREMYNSVYSGYDAVKDELERGWAGEKTRSWIDLIFNDENEDWDAWTAPAEKINEMFKQVKKKIKGTGGFSIADFFTVDANGKTTSQGVWNFFEAIQNKQKEVDKEFVKIGKDGEKIFDFGENGDYQIADLLGMDIESVHSILRAAADAGFEIHLDQPLFSMDELITKAEKAKTALEEINGGKLNINFNPESIEEASEDMAKLQEYKERLLKDNSIEPKVKTQQLEHINSIMELLAARERELSETEIFNFKALDEADQKINKLLSSPIFVKGLSEIDLTPEGLDTVEEIRNAYQYISELRASPDISSEQADYLDQLLQAIIEKLHIIDEEQPEGNSLTYSAWSQGLEIIDKYNEAVKKANESGVSASIDWENDEDFMTMVNWLDSLNSGQKTALGIEPDTNAEQLIDMAKNGIELEVKSNKGKEQVKQELSSEKIETTTKITKEETNSYINQQLNTIDLGKETREEAIKESEEFDGNTYTATFDGDNNPLMQKEKESEDAVNKVGAMEAVPSVTLSGVGQVISGAETIKGQIASIKGKTIEVVANFVSNGLSSLKSRIQSLIDKANELSSTNYSVNFANGTAHAYGTAFVKGSIVSNHAYASGKWGLPNDQTALTGELGTEIVVRDGNWFTVGEDGAEFVNLKKGDIVFNHKQAQELLENGYVTSNKGRGHLVGFANGTAYSYGSSSGALRPSKTSTGMGGSSRSSSGSGGSGGSSGGNSSSNNAKETKNTLDEVEILIGRIEARISDLDKIIGSTYNTWEDRNDSILDNLKLVTQEISDQRKAYTTYINKANSVGLSESWKQKIRDGAFRIEDVTDSDLWDKIQEYQTW